MGIIPRGTFYTTPRLSDSKKMAYMDGQGERPRRQAPTPSGISGQELGPGAEGPLPPPVLRQRPAPTGSCSRCCPALSAHSNKERDEGLGLPFRPWGCAGSPAINSARENTDC